ncbi:PepSY-associated TM helix domain-containing protein [Dyadobacter psychrotolerans]|nr:PepSY-associated TM helix domain-containing protein [Dyadobacter psychrotolerans]
MKLKGLSNRLYNITFHTHTVSGIVISFALYVIFFAGAFTLFKEEFYQWENPQARKPITEKIDYDELLATIKKNKPSFDLSEDITIRIPSKEEPRVQIYGHEIVPKGKPEIHYAATYFPITKTFSEEEKTTIGETLYRLHFFDQIPFIGRYLSGFVALFFAFAVVTGVMIHWRNIFSKFNGFSIKGTWKQIWTNSHTVFGLLGLPFQFMYAITGAYYMLSLLVLLPVVIVFYNGDQEKALKAIVAERAMDTNENSPLATKNQKITNILDNLKKSRPDVELHYVQIKNYNRVDGMMAAAVENSKTFAGDGSATFSLKDGKMVANYLPGSKTYAQSVLYGITRLHYATFGGLILKAIYFLLALFTGFVIISGILLWKEARNKKTYTDKQKRFHHQVTKTYLAICFGLFPAVAILFSAELSVPDSVKHVFWVRTAFFVSWLIFTIAGLFSKNEAKATQLYLFLGGLFSIIVPLINGFVTGDWIWVSLAKNSFYVAGTDLFWLIIGVLSLFLTLLMNKDNEKTNSKKEILKVKKQHISLEKM